MSTGATVTRKSQVAIKATSLRFEHSRLIVAFDDDREVSVPFSKYPTLQRATSAQRNAWELIGPGKAIHWPLLDLDLSVAGIMSGLPEVLPKPPTWKVRRVRFIAHSAHSNTETLGISRPPKVR